MPKTLLITCDVCDTDITNDSMIRVTYKNNYLSELNTTLYFCDYQHMYQYLDNRRPKNHEKLKDCDLKINDLPGD